MPPFFIRDESVMALFRKMFVRSYFIIVPNFKFVSQSAQFNHQSPPLRLLGMDNGVKPRTVGDLLDFLVK